MHKSHSTTKKNVLQMWVAVNGPEMAHCTGVVRDAMASYWSSSKLEGNRRGHFVRRSEKIKSYTVSETVDSIVNTAPKVPFML